MTVAVVRDRAEAVVGWRYWQVSTDRRLRSVTQKWIEWPPGQPLRARCLEVNHPAPDVDCACGVYGTRDLEGLKDHGLCLFPESALVIGEVALWGRVAGDAAGWRGELAYPVSLSLVADTVGDGEGELALVSEGLARYGVPVGATSLEDAVAGASAAMLRFQAMSMRASRTWGAG